MTYQFTRTGAAIETIQGNADDSNVGKTAPATVDADSFSMIGFTRATTNTPAGDATAIIEAHFSADLGFQIGNRGSSRYYMRWLSAGSWNTSWDELWHTANFQPETTNGLGVVKLMQNSSAATIADGGTIAGSSLLNTKFDNTGTLTAGSSASGTWQNVTGESIAQNESGYFVRTA